MKCFIPSLFTLALSLGVFVSKLAADESCSTPPYGSCGSSSGFTCCLDGYYCMPWNPSFYQCMTNLSQCTKQFTDISFDGQDLVEVKANQPSECCSICASTKGCKAYSYDNYSNGSPVCKLKSGSDSHVQAKGYVSGIVNNPMQ